MEYLTLTISTPRGPVYRKDFSVDDLCGPFVRTLVADLLSAGAMVEGQPYRARVVPDYELPLRFPLGTINPADRPGPAWDEQHEWLTLSGAGRPESPWCGFTVYLRTQAPNETIFVQSFPVTALDIQTRIVASLIKIGVVRGEDGVRADLHSRSGERPAQDVIHALPEEWGPLSIRVERPAPEKAILERTLPPCHCGDHSADTGDPLTIVIKIDAIARLQDDVRRHGSRRQESGGILIGDVYRVPSSERLFVEVEDFIAARDAEADAVSLRFTHRTWQELHTRRQHRFGDTKRVVGWYHTHPPVPMRIEGADVHSIQFFSREDHAMHAQVFTRPWQVALVMDAESSEMTFFRWHGQSLVQAGWHSTR